MIRSGRSVQNELLANLLNDPKELYYFYAVLLNKPSQNSVHDISFLIFWRNMRAYRYDQICEQRLCKRDRNYEMAIIKNQRLNMQNPSPPELYGFERIFNTGN